jgi:MYXO-CTERM domain-containing protein
LIVHHGPYSSSLHGNNDKFQTGELIPLLTKHKVDMVISGHDHVYERGNEGLLRYVVSGGGGAPLYPLNEPLPQTKKAVSDYHYVKFTMTSDKVSMIAKRPDATRIEEASFSAKSQSAWDGEQPIAQKPAATTAPTSTPASPKKSDCDCTVQPTRASGAASVGLLLVAMALVRRRLASRARSALR